MVDWLIEQPPRTQMVWYQNDADSSDSAAVVPLPWVYYIVRWYKSGNFKLVSIPQMACAPQALNFSQEGQHVWPVPMPNYRDLCPCTPAYYSEIDLSDRVTKADSKRIASEAIVNTWAARFRNDGHEQLYNNPLFLEIKRKFGSVGSTEDRGPYFRTWSKMSVEDMLALPYPKDKGHTISHTQFDPNWVESLAKRENTYANDCMW